MNVNSLSSNKCTGCYSCYNICPAKCISMESNHEGFWHPKIDEARCLNCGACYRACPVLTPITITNKPTVYACYNKNDEIREQSSSGGIFTTLAKNVQEKNGVVFGATFDNRFNVIHDYTDSPNSLRDFRGSKYVQSKIGDTFVSVKEYLRKDRLVLFVGTPCQVEGLIAFLGEKPNNLLCVDFFCHGVSSPIFWNKYIDYQEKIQKSKIIETKFRDKKYGWKDFSMKFKFRNGKSYIRKHNEDPFFIAYLSNLSLRKSCYNCSFKKLQRISDFTLADFWGVNNILPKMNDDKGLSVLIVNSDEGKNIFNEISQKLNFQKTELGLVIKSNSAAVESVLEPEKRKHFFYDLHKLQFEHVKKKYLANSLLLRTKKYVKGLLIRYLRKIYHAIL